MTKDDHQLELLISLTLRSGVALAVALGVVGGVLFLSHHGTDRLDFGTFWAKLCSLGGFSTDLRAERGLNRQWACCVCC